MWQRVCNIGTWEVCVGGEGCLVEQQTGVQVGLIRVWATGEVSGPSQVTAPPVDKGYPDGRKLLLSASCPRVQLQSRGGER